MRAVNLLPSDMRGAPQGSAAPAVRVDEAGGPGPFVVLGALAMCVAALAAYVVTNNTINDRQAKLTSVSAQGKAVAAQAEKLKPYADFQALAEARISTVRDLAGSRFDWEQSLRGISRAIPADVTLKSLTGTVSGQANGGASTIRGAIGSPAIELKGCTPGQRSVARLMSRLRNVDGVTRVSLSKSIRPDTAASTAGPAGSGGVVDSCGTGRPPAFEVVMFFEKSTVPSSVQEVTLSNGQPAAGAAGQSQPAGQAAPAPNGQPAPANGQAAPASTTPGATTR